MSEALSELSAFKGSRLALSAYISLEREVYATWTNTPAYFEVELVTAVESFIVQSLQTFFMKKNKNKHYHCFYLFLSVLINFFP